MPKLCDAVFEGGGVKGIGLVGGVCGIEEAGYEFRNVAGTSAGAIVASLLAVGYTGAEIREEMLSVDFSKFQGDDWLTKLGAPGKAVKLAIKKGVYSAGYFEDWLEGLLERKGKTRFADIRSDGGKCKYRFQAVASDLSDGCMLALPGDLANFGLEPDAFSIARAVRMSMSIPIYYEPYLLTDADGLKHVIVDGGLLSNYPMWLLDDRKPNPQFPLFGFKFCPALPDGPGNGDYQAVDQLAEFMKALVRTTLDAHDKHYISISKGDHPRTISISTEIEHDGKAAPVNSVNFSIKSSEQEALYENGFNAAKAFIKEWDFEKWKSTYRGKQ